MWTLALFFSLLSAESACPKTDEAETVPEKANFSQVIKDIESLKTVDGRVLIPKVDVKIEIKLRELFEANPKTISKLEQFYGLLFWLAKFKVLPEKLLSLDPVGVRKLLVSSKVYSTPQVPDAISRVNLIWNSHFEQANYEVEFSQKELRLKLNNGKGFASFKEGLCQVARELIFYGGFEFQVRLNSSQHIEVRDFKKVDLFGTFGARGAVNVDINYVAVKSVEFLKGSNRGIVRAKVSPREWETNDHTWVLKLVSQFVTDKSEQPIDW